MNLVFVVTDFNYGSSFVKADEIARALFEEKIWLFSERTPYRMEMSKGDRVIVYIGGTRRGVFVADFVLKSTLKEMLEPQKRVAQGLGIRRFKYFAELDKVNVWQGEVQIRNLIPKLSFIKNKQYWGQYFRRGIIKLSDQDMTTISSDSK